MRWNQLSSARPESMPFSPQVKWASKSKCRLFLVSCSTMYHILVYTSSSWFFWHIHPDIWFWQTDRGSDRPCVGITEEKEDDLTLTAWVNLLGETDRQTDRRTWSENISLPRFIRHKFLFWAGAAHIFFRHSTSCLKCVIVISVRSPRSWPRCYD